VRRALRDRGRLRADGGEAMTEESKNRVSFDREFWPTSGTIVPGIPRDLTDLWDDQQHEDPASVFVAESLIDYGPTLHLDLDSEDIEVVAYLWDVGGDTLALRQSLIGLVEEETALPRVVRSAGQADEARIWIATLTLLEEKLGRLKQVITAEVETYEKVL
jgi:hypothetical protein